MGERCSFLTSFEFEREEAEGRRPSQIDLDQLVDANMVVLRIDRAKKSRLDDGIEIFMSSK